MDDFWAKCFKELQWEERDLREGSNLVRQYVLLLEQPVNYRLLLLPIKQLRSRSCSKDSSISKSILSISEEVKQLLPGNITVLSCANQAPCRWGLLYTKGALKFFFKVEKHLDTNYTLFRHCSNCLPDAGLGLCMHWNRDNNKAREQGDYIPIRKEVYLKRSIWA